MRQFFLLAAKDQNCVFFIIILVLLLSFPIFFWKKKGTTLCVIMTSLNLPFMARKFTSIENRPAHLYRRILKYVLLFVGWFCGFIGCLLIYIFIYLYIVCSSFYFCSLVLTLSLSPFLVFFLMGARRHDSSFFRLVE